MSTPLLTCTAGTPPTALSGLSRRSAVTLAPALAAALATSAGGVRPATADVALETYTDKEYGVSFGIPKGWTAVPNELADGRVLVAATDPMDPEFNLYIIFSPIAGDYTSLGSFGTIDYVAGTVIPECNKATCSIAAGDPVEGKMLGQETVKGNYVYDYTIQQVNQPTRRLRSVWTVLKSDKTASSRLIALTAQCLDSKYKDYEPTMKAVIASYKNP